MLSLKTICVDGRCCGQQPPRIVIASRKSIAITDKWVLHRMTGGHPRTNNRRNFIATAPDLSSGKVGGSCGYAEATRGVGR